MEDLDAIEAVEAACFPPAEAATNESLTAREVMDVATVRYDKDGDDHYDVISAFIKSMRGSVRPLVIS